MLPKLGKRVPGPYYDLEAFQAEVRARRVHVYRGRAMTILQEDFHFSQREARRFAWDAVLALSESDYAHSLEMPDGQVHDVYGLVISETGWYLKIEIRVGDGQPASSPAIRRSTT